MNKIASRLTFLACFLFANCASFFLHGGSIVDSDYRADVIVEYTAQEFVPAGYSYSLVRVEAGEAIFERNASGGGSLFTNHWNENGEDHYCLWVRNGEAFEVVIPEDRTQPGKKYAYNPGYYTIEVIDGVERPVPTVRVEPVAVLIPK